MAIMIGYIFGFSEGVDASSEFIDSLELTDHLSMIGLINLKPSFLWIVLSGFLPMIVLCTLFSIRYVAVSIKKDDSAESET